MGLGVAVVANMSTPPLPHDIQALRKATVEECLREGFTPYRQSGGRGSSAQEAAKRMGIRAVTLNDWIARQMKLAREGRDHFEPDWSQYRPPGMSTALVLTMSGAVRRWILTGAQDDTPVHQVFWNNLNAYARHMAAEIMVGGFTYQKGLYEDHATRTALFAETVRPFIHHENEWCGGLMFAARMNTLPTAVRPLSGLDTYTRGNWGVFPHAKVQMISVPALPGRHPAMLMTTGACTVPNYIQKKAGQKAEFHHQIGATIVEVDSADRIFCRQIVAADDGSFQDLTNLVKGGRVIGGQRAEGITWGDIHREQIDPEVARVCWGIDIEADRLTGGESIVDALRPRHQFFHDLLDFRSRNHHRRSDHHHKRRMFALGSESIDSELAACARFLELASRDFCASVVIPSNHNDAFERWLREADPREDAVNAPLWCRGNAAMYDAIDSGDETFDVFRWGLERQRPMGLPDVAFPPRNGSYIICQASGGIECALHGDQGPNGARGSALALSRVAVRMNVGHAHTASILDGVYTAGLCGRLDQSYNEGPSSWSHTQIVTYPNGRRSLITIIDGRWRA